MNSEAIEYMVKNPPASSLVTTPEGTKPLADYPEDERRRIITDCMGPGSTRTYTVAPASETKTFGETQQ